MNKSKIFRPSLKTYNKRLYDNINDKKNLEQQNLDLKMKLETLQNEKFKFKYNMKNQLVTVKKHGKDIVTKCMDIIYKNMYEPVVLMTLAITAILIYSHHKDGTNSPITKFINGLVSNPSTKILGEWMKEKISCVTGMIIYLPVLISLDIEKRNSYIVIVSMWTLFSPTEGNIQYALQAILLFFYEKLDDKTDKIFILIAGFFLMISGFLMPLKL